MFSDLALVDWFALVIAAMLLCIAAIAALLARSEGSRESLDQHRAASSRYSPNHAATGKVEGGLGIHLMNHAEQPPKPGHAIIPGISPGPPAHAAPQGSKPLPFAKPGKHSAKPGEGTPLLMARSTPPAHLEIPEPLDLTDSVTGDTETDKIVDLTDDSHTEKLAERAARLRGRPVSEPESKRQPLGYATQTEYKRREPGFFADPIGRHELRYWNGTSWTEYAKEGSERVIDPI